MPFKDYEALQETLFWLAHRDPNEPSTEQIKTEARQGQYPTFEQVKADLIKTGIISA